MPTDSNLDALVNRMVDDENGAPEQAELRAAQEGAIQRNPDTAARALRVARRDGMTFEVVLDNVEKDPQHAELWEDIGRNAPVLNRRLREDPGFAAVTQDSVKDLSLYERMFRGWDQIAFATKENWKAGWLTVEKARLAAQWRDNGGVMPEQAAARLQEILQRESEIERTDQGWLARAIPNAAQSLPLMISGLPHIAERAAAGATTFGLAAAATGAAVTAPVGGEGVLAAVPGASLGAATGAAYGVFETTSQAEGPLAYLEYRKGGASHEEAWLASHLVGMANGALEAVSLGKVLKVVPGAKALLGKEVVKDTMRAILRDNTRRMAFARLAGRLIESTTFEGATEYAQEWNTILGGLTTSAEVEGEGGRLVRQAVTPENPNPEIHWSVAGERAKSAGIEGAGGGLGMGLFGIGLETRADFAEVARAEARVEHYKALGKQMQATPAVGRAADVVQEHLESVAQDAGTPGVSVPAEALHTLFQTEEMDPATVARTMPEVAKQLAEADRLGDPKAEVTMSAAEFAVRIAPLKGFDAIAEDVREGDGLTGREAKQVKKEAEAFKADMEKNGLKGTDMTPAARVFEDVRAKLEEAGEHPDVARTDAALWAAMAQARASRGLAKDAWEYYQRQALKVEQSELKGVPADTQLLQSMAEKYGADWGEVINRMTDDELRAVLGMTPGKATEKAAPVQQPKGEGTNAGTPRAKEAERAAQKEALAGFQPKPMDFSISAEEARTLAADELFRRMGASDDVKKLLQSKGKTIRGAFDRRTHQMTLTGKANLSTFLHESGHAFFELLQRDALDGHAESVMDLDVLRAWMGAKDGEELTREQLEKFARGFETYLMEGKAPSKELQATFARVKAWMTRIYHTLLKLDAPLTDEVRDVFDRLLATDEAIAEQRQRLNLTEQFAGDEKIRALHEKAYDLAVQQAENEAIRIFRAAVRHDKERVQAEVAEELRRDPARNALAVLRGEARPDGQESPAELKGLKLRQGDVDGLLPEKLVTKLRRLGAIAKVEDEIDAKGNVTVVSPDDAAPSLGYKNGFDLVWALAGLESEAKVAKRETDARLGEKYEGYQTTPGWLEETALKALHNDAMGLALRAELEAVGKTVGRGESARSVHAAAKEAAQATVARLKGTEMLPDKVRRAETQAAKDFQEALAGKKMDEAWAAKRRQLYYHEMYDLVSDAKQQFEKIRDYLKSFDDVGKRKALSLAGRTRTLAGSTGALKGTDFLAAIDNIRELIDLKRRSNKYLSKQGALAQLIRDLEAEGEPIQLPPDVQEYVNQAGKNYRQMTLPEFQAFADAVKQIEHRAREINKVTLGAEKHDLDVLATKMAEHANANAGEAYKVTRESALQTDAEKKSWWRQAHAEMTKMEFLARDLDGGQVAGFFHRNFFQPLRDAERAGQQLYKSTVEKARKLFEEFTLGDAFRLNRTVSFLGTATKMRTVLAIALNMGNEGNKARLLNSLNALPGAREWTEPAVLAELDRLLTDKDIAVVQKVHDLMGSLWPLIVAQEERVTGVTPEAVPASPVRLPSGRKWAGGYYPIVKSKQSRRAAEQAQRRDIDEKNFLRPGVFDGFVHSRGTDMSPLDLDLAVIPGHLQDVIHYLTHSEVVRGVDKLTRHEKLETAIKNAKGPEMYRQIRPWLISIARGSSGPLEETTWWDAPLRHLRFGGTIVMYGAKLRTALMQQLGHLTTISEVGLKYTTLGIYEALKFSGDATRDSIEIQALQQHFDRDLADLMKYNLSKFSPLRQMGDKAATFTMSFLLASQRFASTVAWYGARAKALAENHPNPVAYADSIVAMTQAGGGLKDLASIQRGNELKKMVTVAYTYFSVFYNQTARRTGKEGFTRAAAAKAGQMFWLAVLPVVVEGVLAGRAPEEEDDPEAWAKWTALETGLYMSRAVPGVSSLGEAMLSDREPRSRAPWWDAAVRGVRAGAHGLKEGELSSGDITALSNLVGTAAHLPAGAAVNAALYLDDYDQMEEEWLNLLFRSTSDFK